MFYFIKIYLNLIGIAATILRGGRTAHSTLKLPLDLENIDNPVCNITPQSDKGQLLFKSSIIIWDEAPMIHKNGIEALNRTLQDIMNNKKLFGGKIIVLSGDFRQILPVVTRGTKENEIFSCIKYSQLWKSFKIMKLTINMRHHLHINTNNTNFPQELLKIGAGAVQTDENDNILLSETICKVTNSYESLKTFVYSDFQNNYKNVEWISNRCLLATTNDAVRTINNDMIEQIPDQSVTYKSIDSVVDSNETTVYPVEFLNTLNNLGLADHELILKIGAAIIVIRNINPPKLCNGTKLIITGLKKNLIKCLIITGCAKGETVFIPRIHMISTKLPFIFKRTQFPVKLAYALTINKCQGQTYETVGISLIDQCFAHGQLYVALSRAGSEQNIIVLSNENKAKNIVYKEVI